MIVLLGLIIFWGGIGGFEGINDLFLGIFVNNIEIELLEYII